jgi:hypothetical protein
MSSRIGTDSDSYLAAAAEHDGPSVADLHNVPMISVAETASEVTLTPSPSPEEVPAATIPTNAQPPLFTSSMASDTLFASAPFWCYLYR